MTDEGASRTSDFLTFEPATFCVTCADSSFGKMRRLTEESLNSYRPTFVLWQQADARPLYIAHSLPDCVGIIPLNSADHANRKP